MYPNFEKLIDLIVSYDFTWSFVSNGRFYKKYIPIFDKHIDKLKFIGLSFDDGKEETHDFIRQKCSFKRVIKDTKFWLSKGIFVRFVYTLNSKNVDEVQDFVKLALEI